MTKDDEDRLVRAMYAQLLRLAFPEIQADYRERNRGALAEVQRAYRAANRKTVRATALRYYYRNREAVIAKQLPVLRRQRETLSDKYVALVLTGGAKIELPPGLIEAKRQHLKLKRALREKKQCHDRVQ